eukprot:s1171_g3.t1
MFAKAMQEAGVSGNEVGYVEAHAPGTKLGDKVESEAWGRCLKMGASRSVPIGSVKSYMGHLEGASGIAGIMNLVLMMRHSKLVQLCPSAFKQRRTDVDWDSLGIFPLAEDGQWRKPVGFVSSFGFGGASAVCGFQQAPDTTSGNQPNPQLMVAKRGPVVFVFSGMGTQKPGMLQNMPPEALIELNKIKRQLQMLGFDLDKEEEEEVPEGEDTQISQVLIFAHQVCLARWFIEKGVKPDICIGHSLGEVAAFHIAGRISLEDAVRIIFFRAKHLQETGRGRMIAVKADEESVKKVIQEVHGDIDIAAYNSPSDFAVAGTEIEMKHLKDKMDQKKMDSVELSNVKKAFHSKHVQGAVAPLVRDIGSFEACSDLCQTELVSTVTGKHVARDESVTAAYWGDNLRKPVLFSEGIKTILQQHPNSNFIEIAASSHLCRCIKKQTGRCRSSELCRQLPGGEKWARPWNRETLRLQGSIMEQVLRPQGQHPLLGAALELSEESGRKFFENQNFSIAGACWMVDHKIQGQVICPGMAFVEVFLECARQCKACELAELEVRDVEFKNFLDMTLSKAWTTQTVFHLGSSEHMTFSSLRGEEWKLHAKAKIVQCAEPPDQRMEFVSPGTDSGWKCMSSEELYQKLADFFHLGKAFQGIKNFWHRTDGRKTEVVTKISLEEGERCRIQQYNIHPALLDSIIQSGLGFILVSGGDFRGVPYHLGACRLLRGRKDLPCDLLARCDGTREENGFRLDVEAFDRCGQLVCSIRGLFFKNMDMTPSPLVRLGLKWEVLQDQFSSVDSGHGMEKWLFIWMRGEGSEPSDFETFFKSNTAAKHRSDFPAAEHELAGVDHVAIVANFFNDEQDMDKLLERLYLIIAFFRLADRLRSDFTITLVTHGGVAIPEDGSPDVDPIQAMISQLGIAFAHETSQLRIRLLDLPHHRTPTERNHFADAEKCLIHWPQSSEQVLRWMKQPGEVQAQAQIFAPSLVETLYDPQLGSPLEEEKLLIESLSLMVERRPGAKAVLTWSARDLQMSESIPLSPAVDSRRVLRRLENWLVPYMLRYLDYDGRIVLLQGLVDQVDIERLEALSKNMRCEEILVIQKSLCVPSGRSSSVKVGEVSAQAEGLLDTVAAFAQKGAVTLLSLMAPCQLVARLAAVVAGSPMSTVVWKTDIHSLMKSEGSGGSVLAKSINLMLEEEAWLCTFEDRQAETKLRVRPGTYIVAGGTRGLGLQMAQWLQEHGASTVVILGRKKPLELPEKLVFKECDVTEKDQVKTALGEAPLPLAGIISMATEYHDKPLAFVEVPDLAQAIRVKVLCARHLHQACEELELDRNMQFLAVSSIATLFGNHSQAAYVMANRFVEGLMQHRRAMSLHGSFMNVGVVSDVGFAAKQNLVREWQARGIKAVSSADVCLAMGQMLAWNLPSLGLSRKVDTMAYFQAFPHLVHNMQERGNLSRLKGLMLEQEFQAVKDHLKEQPSMLGQTLHGKSAEEKEVLVKGIVGSMVGKTLNVDPKELKGNLEDYSLDSQSADQIRRQLTQKFKVSVDILLIMKKGVKEISDSIVKQLDDSSGSKWWRLMKVTAAPRQLLLCVPPNGLGTLEFESWLSHLEIPVLCAAPPGWQDRSEEACVDDANLLTNHLFQDLLELLKKKGWTDLPLILYGHSFGAPIALSLAKEIEASSELRLELFCPAAWCAPGTFYHERYPEHMKVEPEKLSKTEDADFAKGQLRCFEFLPSELYEKSAEAILRTARCVAASLKMLKQDWAILQGQLKCPIIAFAGGRDTFATVDDMWNWCKCSKSFSRHRVEGDHAFLTSAGKDICSLMISAVNHPDLLQS